MSLYADYIKEREGKNIIENNYGFATYFIKDKECFLVDVYVIKESRKHGICQRFVKELTEIAQDAGCDILTTTVCPKAKNSTISLKVTLGCGFELDSSVSNLILFKKEI